MRRRVAWGLNVSFTEGVARHFPGRSALRHAIEFADEHELRIRCISTPESILRDLQGSRAREQGETKYLKHDLAFESPELRMLIPFGRTDLLDPPEPLPVWHPLRLSIRRTRTDHDEEGKR